MLCRKFLITYYKIQCVQDYEKNFHAIVTLVENNSKSIQSIQPTVGLGLSCSD